MINQNIEDVESDNFYGYDDGFNRYDSETSIEGRDQREKQEEELDYLDGDFDDDVNTKIEKQKEISYNDKLSYQYDDDVFDSTQSYAVPSMDRQDLREVEGVGEVGEEVMKGEVGNMEGEVGEMGGEVGEEEEEAGVLAEPASTKRSPMETEEVGRRKTRHEKWHRGRRKGLVVPNQEEDEEEKEPVEDQLSR